MTYYCNPLNIEYRYQFNRSMSLETRSLPDRDAICREAADPTMIRFKGRYWLFPSMSAGFYVSDDLSHWKFHALPDAMPLVDYAPDVRVIGDWMYFCASRRGEPCDFWRSRDPLEEPFERIAGSFEFWDPNLFLDDDGALYLYWGCSNITPVWGVRLDPTTMQRVGEPRALVPGDPTRHGFDRIGDDNMPPKTQEEVDRQVDEALKQMAADGGDAGGSRSAEGMRAMLQSVLGNNPYIEGAYMTKHDGTYYLQISTPGTQYNTYADAVYVSDSPLGDYRLAANNPFSFNPGGFITGAGHGSTLQDADGAYWHTATMRISMNQTFERRLGLWKAGFDRDGELYCDQRFGDWPRDTATPAWSDPEWMLLSYGADATASSGLASASNVTDEDIRTWWRADTSASDAWVRVDLGGVCDVRAIQLNFADQDIIAPRRADMPTLSTDYGSRAIDPANHPTYWLLEGSVDGREWLVLDDHRDGDDDHSHPFLLHKDGMETRYLRLTVTGMPFGQPATVSGIRVFGPGVGPVPAPVSNMRVERTGDLDMTVSWDPQPDATGHIVQWGHTPDKLYHSWMVYGQDRRHIGALVKGQPVYVRVDSFNRGGVTHGVVMPVPMAA